MREILFKAKRLDNDEWVEGVPIFDGRDEQWRIIIQLEYSTGTCISSSMAPIIIQNTICQYTGLTDKNGNKIWENDLIKCYYASGNEMAISQIVFSEGSLNLGWCKKDLKSLCIYNDSLLETGIKQRDAKECDVIGNIFDNPELLGV